MVQPEKTVFDTDLSLCPFPQRDNPGDDHAVTRTELVRRLSQRTSLGEPTVRGLFEALALELIDALARGEPVSLPMVGRFKLAAQNRVRPCRLTGQSGRRYYPAFRPTSSLKVMVSARRQHLERLKDRRELRARAAREKLSAPREDSSSS